MNSTESIHSIEGQALKLSAFTSVIMADQLTLSTLLIIPNFPLSGPAKNEHMQNSIVVTHRLTELSFPIAFIFVTFK